MDPSPKTPSEENSEEQNSSSNKESSSKKPNAPNSSGIQNPSHHHKLDQAAKDDPSKTASPNQTLKELAKQFMTIVRKGNLNEISSMIEQYSLDVIKLVDDNFRQTAIFHSVMIKDNEAAYNAIKFFIDKGVNAGYSDILNQTALFYVAREGKANCVEILVKNGCSVNHRDQYFQTPLNYAAREGQLEVSKKLIEHGADVNNIDYNNQTPIYYSAKEGNIDMCNLLISAGAKLNIFDEANISPIQVAKKAGKTKLVELFLSLGAVLPPQNQGREKRRITKKTPDTPEKVGIKKYVLTYFKDGTWAKLEGEELLKFVEKNPEIGNYLKNPKSIDSLELKKPPEGVQIYDHWEKAAKRIMASLWKTKDASLFHEPVDSVALNIPDYPDVIKRPMDFGTIKQKLNTGAYANVKDFISDVELTFSNCIEYNGEASEYGVIAKKIREEFRNQQEGLRLSYYM